MHGKKATVEKTINCHQRRLHMKLTIHPHLKLPHAPHYNQSILLKEIRIHENSLFLLCFVLIKLFSHEHNPTEPSINVSRQ